MGKGMAIFGDDFLVGIWDEWFLILKNVSNKSL